MIDLVCTIDENYVPHCAAMLASVMENTKSQLNVYIIHDGINSKKLKKLTGFVEERGHTATGLMCDIDMLMGAPVTDHISLATYFRLLIPKLLPQSCRKVLFLDSDIVVVGDIYELYSTPLEGAAIAAVHGGFPPEKVRQNLNFSSRDPYFNAGVLLINLDEWRRIDLSEQGIELIKNRPEKLITWDQDVLNFLLRRKWKRLNPKWNAQQNLTDKPDDHLLELGYTHDELEGIRKNRIITHFIGPGKPWTVWFQHEDKLKYYKYLKKTPFSIREVLQPPGLIVYIKFLIKTKLLQPIQF